MFPSQKSTDICLCFQVLRPTHLIPPFFLGAFSLGAVPGFDPRLNPTDAQLYLARAKLSSKVQALDDAEMCVSIDAKSAEGWLETPERGFGCRMSWGVRGRGGGWGVVLPGFLELDVGPCLLWGQPPPLTQPGKFGITQTDLKPRERGALVGWTMRPLSCRTIGGLMNIPRLSPAPKTHMSHTQSQGR